MKKILLLSSAILALSACNVSIPGTSSSRTSQDGSSSSNTLPPSQRDFCHHISMKKGRTSHSCSDLPSPSSIRPLFWTVRSRDSVTASTWHLFFLLYMPFSKTGPTLHSYCSDVLLHLSFRPSSYFRSSSSTITKREASPSSMFCLSRSRSRYFISLRWSQDTVRYHP